MYFKAQRYNNIFNWQLIIDKLEEKTLPKLSVQEVIKDFLVVYSLHIF